MIKVKITSKVGTTLERELPANIHELHHALTEMGIRKTPRSILLTDDNAADVEFTADSEIGSGLLRVFGRNDNLFDDIREMTQAAGPVKLTFYCPW